MRRREASGDSPEPMVDLEERRAATVAAALRAMLRDLYQELYGHALPEGELEGELRFTADPSNGWDIRFKQPLMEQFKPQLEALEAAKQSLQMGHVYCYQCLSDSCEHASPPGSMDVFAGYHQLGRPQWLEYTQFLLGLREERVDQLFGEKPRIIARMVDGEVLNHQQFASFGKASKTFSVLGQVVVGYFELSKGLPQAQKLALGIQLVETRDARGKAKYFLNMPLGGSQPDALRESLDRHFPFVRQACLNTRRHLAKWQLSRNSQKPRSLPPWVVAEKARRALEYLAADLERAARKSKRQTQHARFRETTARPIHKAMADVREARPEWMYRDLKTKAIMVCGPKGRCHAFSESGKHITSFVIHQDAVQTRLKKKRWAPLAAEQAHGFLASFSAKPT